MKPLFYINGQLYSGLRNRQMNISMFQGDNLVHWTKSHDHQAPDMYTHTWKKQIRIGLLKRMQQTGQQCIMQGGKNDNAYDSNITYHVKANQNICLYNIIKHGKLILFKQFWKLSAPVNVWQNAFFHQHVRNLAASVFCTYI